MGGLSNKYKGLSGVEPTAEEIGAVPIAGGTMTGTLTMSGAAINEAAEVTIASASSVAIGTAASNNIAISGTTTITSFDTVAAGIRRNVRATGAFKITYNGTSLITRTGKDIVTKANDCFEMLSLGSGNWIMTGYFPSDGRILANAVNNQTGTTYTLAITDLGNDIVATQASAQTYTLPQTSNVAFPIGSKIKIMNASTSGTMTLVKEGSETLTGNTTLLAGATVFVEKTSATSWNGFGGTLVANMPGLNTVILSITTSNTKSICKIQSPCTLLGFTWKAFSVGTAGTFKFQLNGADITGLTGLVPATSEASASATSAVSLVQNDELTIVANGTLVSVADLRLTPNYTISY